MTVMMGKSKTSKHSQWYVTDIANVDERFSCTNKLQSLSPTH